MRHLLITTSLAAALLITGCGQTDTGTQASRSSFATPGSVATQTGAAYPVMIGNPIAGPTDVAYPVAIGNPIAAPVAVLYAAPSLGVVIDKDMRVLAVDRWGVAERAGIQPGDLLESIDGLVFLSNKQQAKEHIHSVKMDQKSIIKLTRNGQALQLELVLQPAQAFERPTATDGRPPPTATPVAPEDDYL